MHKLNETMNYELHFGNVKNTLILNCINTELDLLVILAFLLLIILNLIFSYYFVGWRKRASHSIH